MSRPTYDYVEQYARNITASVTETVVRDFTYDAYASALSACTLANLLVLPGVRRYLGTSVTGWLLVGALGIRTAMLLNAARCVRNTNTNGPPVKLWVFPSQSRRTYYPPKLAISEGITDDAAYSLDLSEGSFTEGTPRRLMHFLHNGHILLVRPASRSD